jgi:hypothetical protein
VDIQIIANLPDVLPMSRNLIDEKIFVMLMAIAMLLAVWVLPTWLWQFSLLSKLFS